MSEFLAEQPNFLDPSPQGHILCPTPTYDSPSNQAAASSLSSQPSLAASATDLNCNDWRKRWVAENARTHSTTRRAIWQHQKLVVLQQHDLNIPTQMKQKRTTLKITL